MHTVAVCLLTDPLPTAADNKLLTITTMPCNTLAVFKPLRALPVGLANLTGVPRQASSSHSLLPGALALALALEQSTLCCSDSVQRITPSLKRAAAPAAAR
jgi:hypothetical protein